MDDNNGLPDDPPEDAQELIDRLLAKRDDGLDTFAPTKEALLRLVDRMQAAAGNMYAVFQMHGMGADCHTFLEFNGLLAEYVKICRRAAENGQDFRFSNPLQVEDYEVEYIAEKLDCIFGPSLRAHPKFREIFKQTLGI